MEDQALRLIDTHAHLCDPVFDVDRDDVLARARLADVRAVVAVGETLADADRNLTLAATHPMIKAAAGLYPTHLDLARAQQMAELIRRRQGDLTAIGEVGLDFWAVQDPADREIQRQIFKVFIDLSAETGLPLNVHSRSAGRHAMAMLLEHGARKVQMHAFDGKAGTALPGVEAGYFFSIPPSVVRSRQKQKLVERLPLECMLVETDSPVLGPEPGQRNEPANLRLVVKTIAAIKAVPEDRVAQTVTANTIQLYGDCF